MKHPSSREFFAYWDRVRGEASAPDRTDMQPGAVRRLLGDIFVLSYDADRGHRFRVAGTRVCALLGCDLKEQSFCALFAAPCRAEIDQIIAAVAEETLPAIAGLTATTQGGGRTHLELLLLPFHTRAHAPVSLTGLLAPFESTGPLAGDLTLTSWRYLHRPQKIVPRVVRKLALARGLMVYEGLS
jgi:hypothetical protein